jgi:hypothetical protein
VLSVFGQFINSIAIPTSLLWKIARRNGEAAQLALFMRFAYFAKKHGVILKAAEIVLSANGPSTRVCDAAAIAFVAALAARAKK